VLVKELIRLTTDENRAVLDGVRDAMGALVKRTARHFTLVARQKYNYEHPTDYQSCVRATILPSSLSDGYCVCACAWVCLFLSLCLRQFKSRPLDALVPHLDFTRSMVVSLVSEARHRKVPPHRCHS